MELPGQIEWAADNGEMFQMRRAGTRQNGDIPGVTPFLVNHETPLHHLWFFRPRLFCPSVKQKSYQTVLQRYPGPRGVSHVSVKQRMLQSLMSRWKLILALRSSILFSKDWTLASRILGRGGLWALFLSLSRIPARRPQCFILPPGIIQAAFVNLGVPKYLQWPRWIRG